MDREDIGERIRTLKARIQQLEVEYYSLQVQHQTQEPISEQEVEMYVADLCFFLQFAELPEQKSIMRSFIKSVKIDLPQVTIEYTLPLPNRKPGGESNAAAFRYKPPTRNEQERLGEFRPPTSSPGNRETNRRCPD